MIMKKELKIMGFDLDGVIVDTAKYHFKAWEKLSKTLGFEFAMQDNERLKGVSRMQSLEILLEIGNQQCGNTKNKFIFSELEKERLATQKNNYYLEYLQKLNTDEILPGSIELLLYFRDYGIKTALASASKNAPQILNKLEIAGLFDAVVDGNDIIKAKPDPEVFLEASKRIGVLPQNCVGFEDSYAGVEAICAANMTSVGIGSHQVLTNANYVIDNLGMVFSKLSFLFEE